MSSSSEWGTRGVTPPPADPRQRDPLDVLATDDDLRALLRAARDRYVERGSWTSGSVALDAPQLRRAAEALGCPVTRGRLKLAALGDVLARRRFRCSLEEAVRWAFGEVPHTHAELATDRAATWNTRRGALAAMAGDARPEVVGWLARDGGTLRSEWQRNPELYVAAETAVRAAVETRRLVAPDIIPILAHRLTGDAHALDLGTPARRYFERILLTKHADLGVGAPLSAEDRADLLAASNLAADGVSSLVWAVGLTGNDAVLSAARASWYALALPLITITALTDVRAAQATVFVVENRSVFGALVPALADLPEAIRPTLVCSSGNPSLAAQTLLGRLVDGGAEVRYGGDTDVRGERIASRLSARFGDRFTRWHMEGPPGVVRYQEAALPAMLADLRRAAAGR